VKRTLRLQRIKRRLRLFPSTLSSRDTIFRAVLPERDSRKVHLHRGFSTWKSTGIEFLYVLIQINVVKVASSIVSLATIRTGRKLSSRWQFGWWDVKGGKISPHVLLTFHNLAFGVHVFWISVTLIATMVFSNYDINPRFKYINYWRNFFGYQHIKIIIIKWKFIRTHVQ